MDSAEYEQAGCGDESATHKVSVWGQRRENISSSRHTIRICCVRVSVVRYGKRSVQVALSTPTFGLFCSACGTGRFTSAP